MPAYAYPIIIVREPKTITYEKEHDLGWDAYLTIQDLKKYYGVKNNNTSFLIYKNENSYILAVKHVRLETKKEMEKRIKREESYMEKYHEFQKEKQNKNK
jgi:hypothetical protein